MSRHLISDVSRGFALRSASPERPIAPHIRRATRYHEKYHGIVVVSGEFAPLSAGTTAEIMKQNQSLSRRKWTSTDGLWCPRSDSNRHFLRNSILSRARLPIPPQGHRREATSGKWRACQFPASGPVERHVETPSPLRSAASPIEGRRTRASAAGWQAAAAAPPHRSPT
jgi:hypothetical protein